MRRLRVLIADDEALSRRLLHLLLARHPDVEIVAECADGESARTAIAEFDPDVAFLDIRMPVASGLDVARAQHGKGTPLVVFVTAFAQFALPAFEVEAVDYIEKPLNEARCDSALARVRERLRQRRAADSKPRMGHLMSRVGTRDNVILLDAVDYIVADGVYAAVMSLGKRHLVRRSLGLLAKDLDASAFVRVHRSYIVRVDRIRTLTKDRRGHMTIALRDGVRVPVARRRRAAVRALLNGLAVERP
jgi:two-component system LytT family response regulator